MVLEPTMISTDQGVDPIAVDIPGVPGARLRSTGMNVDSGMVRVEVLGLGGGIARTATMNKGETLAYENLKITFDDFDLSDFDPQAGKIHFGVVFDVEMDGTHMEVVPTFKGGRGGEPVITPAMVPGTGGITLSPDASTPRTGPFRSRSTTRACRPPDPSRPRWCSTSRPNRSSVWSGSGL